ncbi:peptidyl-prolyl cis-trans isomerase, partial [Candidatus Aminicenantes bacterium AC-334-K16]|nr:peptidyl-prolyl cis-trans isomerase [Candidatus Aminicenantes bacterium AC-334-K16]
LEQLKSGQDFATLARQYSKDDKASAGGDWGLYEWEKLAEKEKSVIKELHQGELSDIIEIDKAFVLLKVTEKQEERLKSLEEVRAQIRSTLSEQKARELAHKRLTKLLRAARREKDLKSAAQKLGFTSQETGFLKAGQPLPEVDPSGVLSQKLFELEKIGAISDPLFSFKGEGIIQLKKIEEARPATFEEARAEVQRDYLEEKRKEKARLKILQLRQKATQNSLEALAKQYGAQYNKVNEHKREEYLGIIGENEKVDKAAFTLPLKEISQPIFTEKGWVLVKPISRKEVSREELAKVEKEERAKLLQEKQNKILISFLAKLRERKKVKINYNLFNQINDDILSRFQKQS